MQGANTINLDEAHASKAQRHADRQAKDRDDVQEEAPKK